MIIYIYVYVYIYIRQFLLTVRCGHVQLPKRLIQINMFLGRETPWSGIQPHETPPRGNPPFEDVSPIEDGDFPMSCWFSGVYWTFGQFFVFLPDIPPWKFNSSSLNIYHPKRKGWSSNHHFSGAMSNFGGVHSRKTNEHSPWKMVAKGEDPFLLGQEAFSGTSC